MIMITNALKNILILLNGWSSKFTPVVSTIVKNNPYNYNKLINGLLPAELEKLKINAEYVILAKEEVILKPIL